MPAYAPSVDVRTLAPRHRHPVIFSTFQELAEGESMEVVSDHDPVALRSHFDLLAPDEASWQSLESGPFIWRVAITRVRAAAPATSCCGACGGGGH